MSDRKVSEAENKLDVASEQKAVAAGQRSMAFVQLRDARLLYHLMMKKAMERESESRAAEKELEEVGYAWYTAVCSWRGTS